MARALTADEQAVVRAMLHGEQHQALLAQVDALQVVGQGCACGCPSIDFRASDDPETAPRGNVDEATARVRASGDFLILFSRGGLLDRLEYVPYRDLPTPVPFPSPAELDFD